MGIFRAIWRFFTFWNLRQGARINERAEEQFTSTAEGMAAGFDLEIDAQIEAWQTLQEAAGIIEATRNEDAARLKELNNNEQDKIELRDTALDHVLKIQKQAGENPNATQKAEMEKYLAHAASYDVEIQEIEKQQDEIEARLSSTNEEISQLDRDIVAKEKEVDALRVKKGMTIADFERSKTVIAAREKVQGMRQSKDKSPIDAILAKTSKLKAQADGMNRRAGVTASSIDAELRQKASETKMGSRMEGLLAARKAEKEGSQSEAATSDKRDKEGKQN